jgi:hypothetical protein
MAAIANIILADGQVSPVNHTFIPLSQEGVLSLWNDTVTGIVAGYPTIMCKTNADSAEAEVDKVTFAFAMPTLEALSAASSGFTPGPTVAYVTRFKVEAMIPRRATQAERDNIAAYAKNLTAHAVFQNAVKSRDYPF